MSGIISHNRVNRRWFAGRPIEDVPGGRSKLSGDERHARAHDKNMLKRSLGRLADMREIVLTETAPVLEAMGCRWPGPTGDPAIDRVIWLAGQALDHLATNTPPPDPDAMMRRIFESTAGLTPEFKPPQQGEQG